MRAKVVHALKSLDAVSVENAVHSGTPDVNFTDGWIELKQVPMPKREATPVRVPHFTPQQRVFLRRRWHRGGKAFMLLLVDDTWVLLDGCWAARYVGDVNYATLRSHAIRLWYGSLNGEDLLECMKNIRPTTCAPCCTAKINDQ